MMKRSCPLLQAVRAEAKVQQNPCHHGLGCWSSIMGVLKMCTPGLANSFAQVTGLGLLDQGSGLRPGGTEDETRGIWKKERLRQA